MVIGQDSLVLYMTDMHTNGERNMNIHEQYNNFVVCKTEK